MTKVGAAGPLMHTAASPLSIADKPQLSRQYALLLRLQNALSSEPRCLGAAAVGSLAEGRGDRMSDVDLVVYCEQGTAGSILKNLSDVAADRPVVHRLQGHHDASSVYEKVILDDWSSYELHVIEPATRMRLRPPYLALIDRERNLETRLSHDKPIGRQTATPYVNGDAGLVWELFNCLKWLRRGEVDFTSRYLQRLGEQLAQKGGAGEA